MSRMCKVMEDMRQEAMEEGMEKTLLKDIASLMDTLKLSADQAMDALKVRAEDRARYLSML